MFFDFTLYNMSIVIPGWTFDSCIIIGASSSVPRQFMPSQQANDVGLMSMCIDVRMTSFGVVCSLGFSPFGLPYGGGSRCQ